MNAGDLNIEEFKAKLEAIHQFPTVYMFKFIVPYEQLDTLKDVLKGMVLQQKPSKGGKYISVTVKEEMESSESVLAVYSKVTKQVPGVISL